MNSTTHRLKDQICRREQQTGSKQSQVVLELDITFEFQIFRIKLHLVNLLLGEIWAPNIGKACYSLKDFWSGLKTQRVSFEMASVGILI